MNALALAVLSLIGATAAVQAQTDAPTPSFWDPGRRVAKPDLSAIHLIRFLTADDYPPFNFALPDGSLTGFNVDLARAVCQELEVSCTIQERRFDTLVEALDDNKGDAVIAALAANARTRAQVDFTAPYFVIPARFVVRAGQPPAAEPTPEKMGAAKVGVAEGSAHAAWLKARFPKLTLRTFDTPDGLRAALVKSEVDAIFGDAVGLGVWLNGGASSGCCAFFGGPFIDAAYFGDGLAIAVRKNNVALRRALDYGLARVAARGVYTELYLKYFPVGVF